MLNSRWGAITSPAAAAVISASNAAVSVSLSCHRLRSRSSNIAKWDVEKVRCTRVPACDLWDEEMLLEERERHRAGVVRDIPGRAQPIRERLANLPVYRPPEPAPPPYFHAIPAFNYVRPASDLQWMLEPGASLQSFIALPSRAIVVWYPVLIASTVVQRPGAHQMHRPQ